MHRMVLLIKILVRRCRRCGGLDHRDARSTRCPENYRNKRQRSSSISSTLSARRNLQGLEIQPSSSETQQRAEGIKRRKLKVASTAAFSGDPCKRCSDGGVYDPERPHGSARSHLCPYYKQDINEYLAHQLGSPPQRYVRKAGMNCAFAENLSEGTRTAFTEVVTNVVDYITRLTIKSQVFAAHFILNLLANPPPTPDLGMNNPIFFDQAFFYACMQLTLGSNNITNPNTVIPRLQMIESFNVYRQQYPDAIVRSPHRSQYAHILAEIASTQATTFTNSVSETFQRRASQFFRFRLRELSQVYIH